MDNKKIPATVIWYNPDTENIENIKTYIDYVEKVYIIDNSMNNNKKLCSSLNNNKIEYVYNKKNLGIAKALNLACEKAISDGFKWILTMDQDSSFSSNDINEYFKSFDNIEKKNTGIFSPKHILKNDINKIRDDKKFLEIDHVMTSGNLLNLSAWEKIGKFDENLFIDEVDSEICFRMIENDYKVIQMNRIKMFHELGSLEKRNFFIKKISVLNHNYIRKYYIMRNKFYMFKKYKKYRIRYVYYILNDFFKVIFYEKDKLRKLKYMFRGINDFFKNKMGELDDKK
nr:glycosyltransferase family 2 protein [uncultured Leptotrichia sp.]